MAEQWYRNVSIQAQFVAGFFILAAAIVAGLLQRVDSKLPTDRITSDAAIYRLRVTVLDPNGIPVDDAKVWSSIGGEPKQIPGGWQFDIPSALKPADGRVAVFASKESAFLKGTAEYELDQHLQAAIVVRLAKGAASAIHGIVLDEAGRGLGDVRITVAGLETEKATTGIDGRFIVRTDASDGEQVLLHAEKQAYTPVMQWHPAGKQPATLILEPRK